ncbi:MAG TPA: hypothetical protein VGR73_01305 [Bryobacteraceae bacterium]|nr:hypothetical protein [Bryobacteraceae bacterium]
MTKTILILLVAILAIATVGSATQNGTLTATCVPGCSGDPAVVITGTGYQNSGHNHLTVIVWGSSNPVDCGTPAKSGSFTCNTTVDGPGYYDVVAYENSRTVIASTSLLVD